MGLGAELAIVLGCTVRRATADQAAVAIAGFSVINDITARDQSRTLQWLQGKTWERTAPFGPTLATPDELPGGVRPSMRMTCCPRPSARGCDSLRSQSTASTSARG